MSNKNLVQEEANEIQAQGSGEVDFRMINELTNRLLYKFDRAQLVAIADELGIDIGLGEHFGHFVNLRIQNLPTTLAMKIATWILED